MRKYIGLLGLIGLFGLLGLLYQSNVVGFSNPQETGGGLPSNLYFDNTNIKMGIGTTTPDAKIETVFNSIGNQTPFTLFYSNKNTINTNVDDVLGTIYIGSYNQLNNRSSTDQFSSAFVNQGFYNTMTSIESDLNLTATAYSPSKYNINLYTTIEGGGGDVNLLAAQDGKINFYTSAQGAPGTGNLSLSISSSTVNLPNLPSGHGRYLCLDSNNNIVSSSVACDSI